MANDCKLLFYTQEEIDAIHAGERLLMMRDSFWYNFTENIIVIKENIQQWLKYV